MRLSKMRFIGFVLLGLAGGVYATNYSLWVNGRSSNAQPGNQADFSYRCPASTAAGVNKISVERLAEFDKPVELSAPSSSRRSSRRSTVIGATHKVVG